MRACECNEWLKVHRHIQTGHACNACRENRGYRTFEDFLADLKQSKRKSIRQVSHSMLSHQLSSVIVVESQPTRKSHLLAACCCKLHICIRLQATSCRTALLYCRAAELPGQHVLAALWQVHLPTCLTKPHAYHFALLYLNSCLCCCTRAVCRLQERKSVAKQGLSVRRLLGSDVTASQWDTFYEFYIATVDKKWGSAYLTREFFHM